MPTVRWRRGPDRNSIWRDATSSAQPANCERSDLGVAMRRREQVPESKRFAAAAVAGLVGALTSFMATVPASAAPNASSRVVLDGPARFEVLTPTLVRLEYAADGHFEDGATFNVVDRNLPVPKFRTRKDGGWLAITTDRLTLRYREGSGPFSPSNTVTVSVAGKTVTG